VVPQAPAKRVHTWAFLKAKKERNGPSLNLLLLALP